MTRTRPNHPRQRDSRPSRVAPDWSGPRSLTAAALHAAAAGWAVFPVRPRAKTPTVRAWEDAATLDPDRIRSWWAATPWNIGIATGPSELLVLDLDVPTIAPDSPVPGDPNGADESRDGPSLSGLAVLRRLAAAAAAAPPWDTFTVATPSGGRHLYFRQPDGAGLRNTQGALGPRIDTRGHGGYVLAAGSRGPDISRYRILRDNLVSPLPAWLHHALSTASPGGAPRAASGREQPVGDDGSTNHEVQVVSAGRIEPYLRAVVNGESRAVTAARIGTRHTTLLRAARRLGQWVGSGALAPDEVRAVLTAAAGGYVGVDGYTARQIERDINDGLAYGATRPRHIDDLPELDR